MLLSQLNDMLGVIFCLHHDGTLCHQIFTGTRISKMKSKDNSIFIQWWKLSILSIYGSGVTVTYFDHNYGWWLEKFVEWVHVNFFFMYFLVLRRQALLLSSTTLKRRGDFNILQIVLKSVNYILCNRRSYYWIKYLIFVG